MKILRRSRQHLKLTCLLVLSCPIFFLNLWVMQKGSTAKLLEAEKLRWIGFETIWAILAMRFIFQARWIGFGMALVLSAAMLGGAVFPAIGGLLADAA